jgi:hypothetical protein
MCVMIYACMLHVARLAALGYTHKGATHKGTACVCVCACACALCVYRYVHKHIGIYVCVCMDYLRIYTAGAALSSTYYRERPTARVTACVCARTYKYVCIIVRIYYL